MPIATMIAPKSSADAMAKANSSVAPILPALWPMHLHPHRPTMAKTTAPRQQPAATRYGQLSTNPTQAMPARAKTPQPSSISRFRLLSFTSSATEVPPTIAAMSRPSPASSVAMMAIPNLVSLLLLSKVLVEDTKKYLWDDGGIDAESTERAKEIG